MTAIDLTTEFLPPIKTSEACIKAMRWMLEFKISHLPVVDGTELIGIISDEDILDINDEEISIEDSKITLKKLFAFSDQHIYEVMKIMSDNQLSVLPILDKNEKYVGATTINHLMTLVTNTSAIKENGSVIVLGMNTHDYSLSQIAQIVESNGSKILSSYITSSPETTKIEVTIKINTTDLSRVMQTFNRYDYNIVESYQENDFEDELQNRYDNLMNYLRI